MSEDKDARERAEQRTLLLPRRDKGSQLERGHALQEFTVEQVLGLGGSSIVYLARDNKLDRRVALKEYLPGTIAMRAPDGTVVPRLPRFAESYDKGLRASSTNRACWVLLTTRHWSRSIASGPTTAPPTWPCRTTTASR